MAPGVGGPGPRKACAAESQGDISPRGGEGILSWRCWLPAVPVRSHVGAHCCISEGWHGEEWRWQRRNLCGLSGWPGRSLSQTSHRGWAQATFPDLAGNRGGFEAAPQSSRHCPPQA